MKKAIATIFLILFASSCNLFAVNKFDSLPMVFQKRVEKIYDMSFSPDGKYFLAYGAYTPIYMWHVNDFTVRAKYWLARKPELPDPNDHVAIRRAGFTNDSASVFAILTDGNVVLIDVDTRKKTVYGPDVISKPEVQSALIARGLFSWNVTSDHKYRIDLNVREASVEIEELSTGKKTTWRPSSPYFTPTTRDIEISSDNDTVAAGLVTGNVRLYSLRHARETGSLDQGGKRSSVDFSPDGTKLLTCSSNDRINLWDVKSGRKIRTWKYDGVRRSLLWLRGTPWFAIGDAEGGLRIESTERDETVFKGIVTEEPIEDIEYLPAERLLLICDIEGNIIAYRIP